MTYLFFPRRKRTGKEGEIGGGKFGKDGRDYGEDNRSKEGQGK